MDRCPHCGRALRPDAESCPHCGSDFETGWNPDADHYGFELPSDEDSPPPREPSPSDRGIAWDTVIGIGTVVLAAGLFFLMASRSRALADPTTLVVIVLLVLSFWFFLVKTRRGNWQESG